MGTEGGMDGGGVRGQGSGAKNRGKAATSLINGNPDGLGRAGMGAKHGRVSWHSSRG